MSSIWNQLFSGVPSGLSVQETYARLQVETDPFFLLNIREPAEFQQGHIAGATLVAHKALFFADSSLTNGRLATSPLCFIIPTLVTVES